MSDFVRIFIQLLVMVVWLLVISRVLVSWANPRFEGSIGRFLFETTEPLLAPIRRVLPSSGTFDLAPLVLILLLGVLVRVVLLR